jgi:hypothetical protein
LARERVGVAADTPEGKRLGLVSRDEQRLGSNIKKAAVAENDNAVRAEYDRSAALT